MDIFSLLCAVRYHQCQETSFTGQRFHQQSVIVPAARPWPPENVLRLPSQPRGGASLASDAACATSENARPRMLAWPRTDAVAVLCLIHPAQPSDSIIRRRPDSARGLLRHSCRSGVSAHRKTYRADPWMGSPKRAGGGAAPWDQAVRSAAEETHPTRSASMQSFPAVPCPRRA